MMRQTKRLKELHNDLLREFDSVVAAQKEERQQALQDRRFYSIPGAMWEGSLGNLFENKPKLEVNKIHLAVIRIFNEYRNNRITVDFVSKDGSDNQGLSDTCDMLYRADEQDSVAEEAYDNAFEEAVGGGFGAWRLCTEYEDDSDEDNEAQRVRIKPIYDADSCVFFDLDAKRQDKSDARRCWVLTGVTPDAFRAEWGKDAASMPRDIEYKEFDWCTPDTVYVAEVYEVEHVGEVIDTWVNSVTEEERKVRESEYEADETLREGLEVTGWELVKSRKIKQRRVHKYIMDGQEILEDCGLIAGTEIPVVPVFGKRWFVDGIERFMGHVRLAKDAQRLKNMQLSKLAEVAALSAVEKPILPLQMVQGLEHIWANDHINNGPYLPINPIFDDNGQMVAAGPTAYTKPPTLSPAMAALLQITEQDMQDILGNQQRGEQMEANQSGKAVELIQNRLDMQSFIYLDNMAKAVKRAGEIWLSMAKDIFVDKGRKLKGINRQGAVEAIELMRPVMKDGQTVEENDLSRADMDVAVDVGPSSATKRQAVVRGITNMLMMTEDPETKSVLTAFALRNMEGEGLSDLNEFYRRRLVGLGVFDPTEEDKKRMEEQAQSQEADPNAEYLKAEAAKSMSQARKAESDTMLNIEKTAQTRADTLRILSVIDPATVQAEFDTMQQQMQPEMGAQGEPAALPAEMGNVDEQMAPNQPPAI
jgi:hypothetical protein